MADNKERNSLMQSLLDETIKTLLDKMKQTACSTCNARAASAQDVNNVIKFLKDNGFSIDPVKEDDALDKLTTELMIRTPRSMYPKLPV